MLFTLHQLAYRSRAEPTLSNSFTMCDKLALIDCSAGHYRPSPMYHGEKGLLMTRLAATFAAMMIGALGLAVATDASAQHRPRSDQGPYLTEHPRSAHYRKKKGPKVRGYIARRGGYSYTYLDSINTYGDSRSIYGGTQLFRDPAYDRQTNAGPFDHGFFFDSGVLPRGGDSPYMH